MSERLDYSTVMLTMDVYSHILRTWKDAADKLNKALDSATLTGVPQLMPPPVHQMW